MKHLKLFEEFIQEGSVFSTQQIDLSQFPNPVTGAVAKIFTSKGDQDGDRLDDITKTTPAVVPAKILKPSQDAVYLGKALGMAIGGVEGGDLGAIISKDNYILDGHHRWAATMFNNPRAMIKGYRSELGIGDLIPVLRSLGDAFGNARRGEPKGGDLNIFKANIRDVMNALENGTYMDPKYYDQEKALAWLEKIGGEKELAKRLAAIQAFPPPAGAPPRDEMPVIDAEKGEDKKAAQLLNTGKIDVRAPYA